MDDGEVELSDHGLLPNPVVHESAPVDTFLDEFLKNTRTCTHTHSCNPPGPDTAHTHTCYHTHTRVIASGDDDQSGEKQPSVPKSRKPSGNREAVRKYREKKKAHTAYLEEEVKILRMINQQLLRKLQGQAVLEADVLRLRTLLLDVRGKIDAELGDFPFKKQCTSGNFMEGDCSLQSVNGGAGLRCGTDFPCLHPSLGLSSPVAAVAGNAKMFDWEASCEPAILDCRANLNGITGQDISRADSRIECMMPTSVDTVGSLVSSASLDD
ncbi:hypothetical protein ACLOJK_000356 [Asimina triloba]